MANLAKFFLWLALLGGGVAAILRATCLRLWIVPSDDALLGLSVMPTLEPGDVLLLFRGGTTTFGELVRCPDPERPGRFIVGRILGEPGDRVVAERASVTVNDRTIGSLYACGTPELSVSDPKTGETLRLACEVERAGGVEYTRARALNPSSQPAPFSARVPEGHLFLASDDRHYHDDSRDFGPVPRDGCRERVVFRLWSARGWFDESRRMSIVR